MGHNIPIMNDCAIAQSLLTIAIPTYNRAAKLRRLLTVIQEEVATSCLQGSVVVLVSDNASIDETPSVASEFSDSNISLEYYRQPENLGFDGNLRFLYDKAQTDYIWYISDDEIPLPGSISTIYQTLQDTNPDVLLFSFAQPPGSTVRQFDYQESVHLVTDQVLSIEHILRYTKLSIFVIRKINFNNYQWRTLDENIGSGWYYISLAFSVLEASQSLLLAIISKSLATCDEDYTCISYTPLPFLHMDKMVAHPFVMKHQSNLTEFYACEGYCQAIQFAFAAKVGSLSPEYPEEYDKFIKELECKISILLKRPRSLLQFIALKMHITCLWLIINPVIRWIKYLPR